MAEDLKQQVNRLEKLVLEMQNKLNQDRFGREDRITGQFTFEKNSTLRIVPQDATTSTNVLYGKIQITGDDITYIDSGGDTRTLTTGLFDPTELTASGAIGSKVSYVTLNHSSVAIAATIAAPASGRFLVISQIDSGTAGHTVTLTAGTYDGTNTIATFNAQYETLVLFGVSATRFVIVENVGAVGLS